MKKVNYLVLCFSFFVLSVSVFAQDTENTATNATGIEEIIVTARQQAESLQDVPVTVSVMSEMDLDRYNITSLTDAAKMVQTLGLILVVQEMVLIFTSEE